MTVTLIVPLMDVTNTTLMWWKIGARYHKQFNVPKESEVVNFNTTFGRFGIFTCFDTFFHVPAVTLVKDFHVDTIFFPTAWMNVLPHLSAIEFHSAWAMGMEVNFLASNLHNPSMNMTVASMHLIEFTYDMKTKEGKLLLPQLDAHPCHAVGVNWNSYASGIEAPSTGNQEFEGTVFFDEFTFLELTGVTGNYTVFQKDLCCHLSYKICTLLKCKTINLHPCGDSVETASTRF
ncbi:hypothetical protein MC885_010712 [Smutsia gigantea]|nr:hypothetical protein MC885_010712 [Smutsia gigantea]